MKLIVMILVLLCAGPIFAAEDSLINLPPGGAALKPGSIFFLPDGRQGSIIEILPDGRLNTDLGLILSPDGVVMEGAEPGTTVQIAPPAPVIVPGEETRKKEDNMQAEPEMTPGALLPASPEQATPGPQDSNAIPAVSPPAVIAVPDHRYTIAELLPKTEVPEDNAKIKPHTPEKSMAVEEKPKERPAPTQKPEQPKKVEKPKKPEPAPKPETPKKEAHKQPGKQEKTRVGQPLRIPEDAPRTGNLSFLEGCWQGTRPEYYSKRTIKECFCFGAGGKTGKRRVIDPIGKRRCIGATKASLSANGVLSVTSSGAACDDGERWGQAEMVCRNTGPSTPCSWVFRDANNGHQSYQIPFVRVESCGR